MLRPTKRVPYMPSRWTHCARPTTADALVVKWHTGRFLATRRNYSNPKQDKMIFLCVCADPWIKLIGLGLKRPCITWPANNTGESGCLERDG